MIVRIQDVLLVAALLAAACKTNGHEHEREHASPEDERRTHSITHFTETTELFVEFPSLVQATPSRFAVHFTRLADFKPVTDGPVAVILSSGAGVEERFEVATPKVPGIFGLDVAPPQAGERQLSIVLGSGGALDRHDLGPVTVHRTAEDAKRRAPEENAAAAARIAYLKEQQWRTEFATAVVVERRLRAAVIANGVIRARPEGEALVGAPVAGRVVASGEHFPRIGMEVRRDEVLAMIAPRVGGDTDLASLELALSKARIDLDHARNERERLEELFEQNAVAKRRVVEARHQEAAAQAELSAAERRLAQYHGTQRAGGSGAAGRVSVRSPIQGTIARVDVAPGAFIEEGHDLFHVVDLDHLWLEVQIPESDVGTVRQATGSWFEVEGYDRLFEVNAETGGRLVAFGGVIDPVTRTAPLMFEFPNTGRDLKIGMFTRVRVLTGESTIAPTVPTSAIVDEAGQDVAYVQVAGESFERRVLRLGMKDGDLVEVRDGVRADERVVTRGGHSIRLAAASGTIPAHGHAH